MISFKLEAYHFKLEISCRIVDKAQGTNARTQIHTIRAMQFPAAFDQHVRNALLLRIGPRHHIKRILQDRYSGSITFQLSKIHRTVGKKQGLIRP